MIVSVTAWCRSLLRWMYYYRGLFEFFYVTWAAGLEPGWMGGSVAMI